MTSTLLNGKLAAKSSYSSKLASIMMANSSRLVIRLEDKISLKSVQRIVRSFEFLLSCRTDKPARQRHDTHSPLQIHAA